MTLDLLSYMASQPGFDPSIPGYNPSPATYPFLAPTGSPAAAGIGASSPASSRPLAESFSVPALESQQGRASAASTTVIAPPAMTSIFPRFTHVDVRLFCFIFLF
jgi:hypothetical protein